MGWHQSYCGRWAVVEVQNRRKRRQVQAVSSHFAKLSRGDLQNHSGPGEACASPGPLWLTRRLTPLGSPDRLLRGGGDRLGHRWGGRPGGVEGQLLLPVLAVAHADGDGVLVGEVPAEQALG